MDQEIVEIKISPLILFDGICNFCNRWVQFVLKRDQKGLFRFAPLQSDAAKATLSGKAEIQNIDSIILVQGEQCFVKSDAVLQIIKNLPAPWPWLRIFKMIPRTIRNMIYDWIAKNRYRWFGKRERCMIPDPKWKDRFLE